MYQEYTFKDKPMKQEYVYDQKSMNQEYTFNDKPMKQEYVYDQ